MTKAFKLKKNKQPLIIAVHQVLCSFFVFPLAKLGIKAVRRNFTAFVAYIKYNNYVGKETNSKS